jgi:hypothetical protein
MPISTEHLDVIVRYEHEFDQGFRQGLALCEELQQDLWRTFGTRLAFDEGVDAHMLKAILLPWSRRFYTVIAHTLFKVLALMQPEDFARGHVNFYLWPGYHSHLLKRRLFYHQGNGHEDHISRSAFGIGLYGQPRPQEWQEYQTSCQTSWYERATTRTVGDLAPASPYHWVMHQHPLAPGGNGEYLASITFTTAQGDGERRLPEHQRRHLSLAPADSRRWGHQLADLLNSLERERRTWVFPDRGDRRDVDPIQEPALRELRCMLIGLWMHAVFCREQPAWWEDLMAEAHSHSSGPLYDRLAGGMLDDVAMDWGDASTGRPPFVTWTTLLLEPLVSPPPGVAAGPNKRVKERPEAYDEGRNIGWATFLCSVPLSQAFLMTARRWLRTMYAAMRNGENSAIHKGRDALVQTGTCVGLLVHDLRGLFSDLSTAIQSAADEASQEASEFRIFAMRTFDGMSHLLFGICQAAVDPAKTARVRKDFYTALSLPAEELRAIVILAAWDVQKNESRENHARVDLPACPPRTNLLTRPGSTDAYVFSLLLVAEMLRNFARHAPAGRAGRWSIDVDARRLLIRLEGVVEEQPRVSYTFDVLHTFLDLLCRGRAETTYNGGLAAWEVEVPLQLSADLQ